MTHHHKQTHSHRQTTHTHKYTHTRTHTHTRTRTHTHTHTRTHTHTHAHTQTHAHTHALALTHTGICIRNREYVRLRNFLELYGKVEAVVRNCLLRWSGHLFDVPSTHLFDQCFCFKHISLSYASIGAFFRWYPPFLCYTKDFTCRSRVTLNPRISATNQNFEKGKKVFLI